MRKTGAVEFGKAQVSSVMSTAFDFAVTALSYSCTHHVVCSNITGALAGGALNCAINYKWTFHGTMRSKRAVAWRYALVWLGSVALNTAGTEYGVKSWRYIIGVNDTCVTAQVADVLAVKAVVAVIVAVFWNFLMQKYYVYRKP